jgi:hypothetical protein
MIFIVTIEIPEMIPKKQYFWGGEYFSAETLSDMK